MVNLSKYIGIPFKNRGSDFSGCDCFGLLRLFYREEFNIHVPDPGLSSTGSKRIFSEYLYEIQSNWITLKEPEQFCGVAMANDPRIPDVVNHFGIYVSGKLLHIDSSTTTGSHIVPLSLYKAFIKGYHRWQTL